MPRLPVPGQDEGAWGTLLNDFLSVELDSQGALKRGTQITAAANAATAAQQAADAAQTTANSAQTAANSKYTLPVNGVPYNDLSSGVQQSLGRADSAIQSIPNTLTFNTQTGATYTLALADAGTVLYMNSSSSQTLTVPNDSTVAFPTGSVIEVIRAGAGSVNISPAGGVTVRTTAGGMTMTPQWSRVSMLKLAANTWHIDGSLA